MKIEGDKALARLLQALPEKVMKNVVKGAVRTGGALIRKEARNRVPTRTGLLKKSLGVKVMRVRPGQTHITAIVGPRSGFSQTTEEFGFVKPANYAHLVELGTATTPARPFMRSGIVAAQPTIVSVMKAKLGKGIEKQALKLRGKR